MGNQSSIRSRRGGRQAEQGRKIKEGWRAQAGWYRTLDNQTNEWGKRAVIYAGVMMRRCEGGEHMTGNKLRAATRQVGNGRRVQ